jgi:hypothetical protein
MPNWCFNRLRVTGPDDDVARFRTQAVGFSPWHPHPAGSSPAVFTFHSLVPIPAEVLAAGYDAAGYAWELQHWGCKWGASEPSIADEWDDSVIYEFDTPWAPPLAFMEQLSRQWPTLVFILDYEESGEGFKGLARAAAGVLEDHCIDL